MTGLVLLAAVLIQGADSPQPDRWRGLILGESTPGDAIQALGKPKTDKPDRLLIWEINKWFDPGLNKKNLRKQTFREVVGFDRVDLYYKDGKLVVIQLYPAKDPILPSALENIYGIEFRPFVGGFQESWDPGSYERHSGQVYPKTYPDSYSLVGISSAAIVRAQISNSGLGAMMKQFAKIHDTAGGGFPGKVSQIQLISRKLENRAGADLLK